MTENEPSALSAADEDVEFNKKWHLVSSNRVSCYGNSYARAGESLTTANVGAWYETACYWRNEAEKLAEELSTAERERPHKP